MRIEFDIEKYNQGGWKVYTKGGFEVEILSTSVRNEKPIVGLIKHEYEDKIYAWFANGSFFGGCLVVSSTFEYDLVMEKERVVKYGIYNNKNGKILPQLYATYKEAKDSFNPALYPFYRIIKINFEEVCED